MFKRDEIETFFSTLTLDTIKVCEPTQRERAAHAAIIMQRTLDCFSAAMAEADAEEAKLN